MPFAWAIEGYLDKELKNDPRYVKTILQVKGSNNGREYSHQIDDYHECTEEELAEFVSPTESAQFLLKKMYDTPKRGLFCFDFDKY